MVRSKLYDKLRDTHCLTRVMEILSLKSSGRMLILIIVTLVLETTVSRLYAFFVPGPHSLEVNLVFFAVAIVIFSCVHVLILLDLKKQIKSLFPTARNWLGVIFRCVMIIQFVLNALLIEYYTKQRLSYPILLIS